MEVSDGLHASAALLPAKSLPVSTAQKAGWAPQQVCMVLRRQKSLGPAGWVLSRSSSPVFLNRRAAAQYRVLASIIPGRERPEETTICYKISLVLLITNLITNTYVSLMYELKKIGKVFTSKFVGTGSSSY